MVQSSTDSSTELKCPEFVVCYIRREWNRLGYATLITSSGFVNPGTCMPLLFDILNWVFTPFRDDSSTCYVKMRNRGEIYHPC